MAITAYPFDGTNTSQDEFSWLFRELADGVGRPYATSFLVGADASGMTVTVQPGFAIVRGHAVRSTAVETLTIDSASTQPRIDLVVLRLDPVSKTILPLVVKGTPAASPAEPAVQSTDTGLFDMVLARVNVGASATNISAAAVVDRRVPIGQRVTSHPGTISSAGAGTASLGYNRATGRWQEAIGTTVRDMRLDAAQVATGTLADARIPGLNASKITGGELSSARIPVLPSSKIPNLDASKITAGTLADARIPSLNASKITAGTFNINRIPTIPTSKLQKRFAAGSVTVPVGEFVTVSTGFPANTPFAAIAGFNLTGDNDIILDPRAYNLNYANQTFRIRVRAYVPGGGGGVGVASFPAPVSWIAVAV